MSDLTLSILFKLVSIVIGFFLVRFGYVLIKKRFDRNEGNVTVSYAGAKLLLENASAGIIFALFGAVIIIVTLVKGIEVQSHSTLNNNKVNDRLIIDTAELPDLLSNQAKSINQKTENVNLDSLYNLAQTNILNKQYLASLKYLYFIKGVLIFEKQSISFNKKVDKDIKTSEVELSEILNKKQSPESSEETRTIKINNDNKDSIR